MPDCGLRDSNFVQLQTSGNAAKQLLRLPTLLRGRSWTIYELISDADKESYDALKKAILNRLDPDTDEHRLAAHDQLS